MKNYTRHIMTAVLCLCTVSCRLVSDKGESIPEVIASQAGKIIIEDNRTYTYTAVARPVRVHRFTAPFDCVVESMDVDVNFYLAAAYQKNSQYEEALEIYNAILALYPGNKPQRRIG